MQMVWSYSSETMHISLFFFVMLRVFPLIIICFFHNSDILLSVKSMDHSLLKFGPMQLSIAVPTTKAVFF